MCMIPTRPSQALKSHMASMSRREMTSAKRAMPAPGNLPPLQILRTKAGTLPVAGSKGGVGVPRETWNAAHRQLKCECRHYALVDDGTSWITMVQFTSNVFFLNLLHSIWAIPRSSFGVLIILVACTTMTDKRGGVCFIANTLTHAYDVRSGS
jgi:hypothetical protein